MPTLLSARLKLDRADQHLEWLAQDFQRIAAENKAVLPKHCRLEPGQRMEIIPPVQPGAEWGLVIGDCVQNLRAALDHSAWSLSPVNVRQASPRKPQFALFDNEDVYRKRGEWRIADIDPHAKAIIEGFQPYNQPNPKADSLPLLGGTVQPRQAPRDPRRRKCRATRQSQDEPRFHAASRGHERIGVTYLRNNGRRTG